MRCDAMQCDVKWCDIYCLKLYIYTTFVFQYYVTFGGEKYVDLGLGNNRVKCRVHKDFRLSLHFMSYTQVPVKENNKSARNSAATQV